MIQSIVRPWILMGISAFYLVPTVAKLISAGDFSTLFSWEAFKDTWFGNFWVFMGPVSRATGEQWVEPLLQGRVKDGRIRSGNDADALPIDGVVLEVGAGSGMWMQVLASISKSNFGKGLKKIYGVEPNPISAASLKQRVGELDLVGTYDVVPVGIEDLQKDGAIEPGSIDCIMTVQCLCSLPEPQKNIKLLYSYLKEGGRWYVYEHVKNDKSVLVSLVQRFTNIPWEYLMGSCHLCRPTRDWIVEAGSWDSVDLADKEGEAWYEMIPHTVGTLTKARK